MADGRIEILTSNGKKIEVTDSFNMSFNYSVADIKDISKVKSSYSKSVQFPGTKNNNQLFGYHFDINTGFDTFNPKMKLDIRVLVNSVLIFKGFFQLKRIIKNKQSIIYEGVMMSDIISLMSDLGDDLVSDLDFSELHTYYNWTEAQTHFNNTWQDGFSYMMYGNEDMTEYTFHTNSTDKNDPKYGYFYPVLFYKYVFEKMLDEKGYSYEGELVNNKLFEREVISYIGESKPKYPNHFIDASKVIVRDTAHANYLIGGFIHGPEVLDSIQFNGVVIEDMNGSWEAFSTAAYSFIMNGIPQNGEFTINFDWAVTIYRLNEHGVTLHSYNGQTLPLWFQGVLEKKEGGGTWTVVQTIDLHTIDIPISVIPGTNTSYAQGNTVFENVIATTPTEYRLTLQLLKDRTDYYVDSSSNELNMDFNFTLRNGLLTIQLDENAQITEGSIVDFSNCVPKDMKQRDIIIDLIKRYDMYIESDDNDHTLLHFNPRSAFYKDADVINWSSKLDYGQQQTISLVEEVVSKTLLFKHKENNFSILETYKDVVAEEYGQYRYSFGTNLPSLPLTNTIESPFSTGPMIKTSFDAYVMYAPEPDKPKHKTMILIHCGERSCNNYSLKDLSDDTSSNKNTYPCILHMDHPLLPSFSNTYGFPQFINYEGLMREPQRTMYSEYWEEYVNDISEGKLFTGHFFLDYVDVSTIKSKMNTHIFINGAYYVINKISDWTPSKPLRSVKVELIRISNPNKWIYNNDDLNSNA